MKAVYHSAKNFDQTNFSNRKFLLGFLWLLKWCKIQLLLLYVFSLKLFIFSLILFVFSLILFIFSHILYIYSVSSYLYSVISSMHRDNTWHPYWDSRTRWTLLGLYKQKELFFLKRSSCARPRIFYSKCSYKMARKRAWFS